jgi:hypothetical protein
MVFLNLFLGDSFDLLFECNMVDVLNDNHVKHLRKLNNGWKWNQLACKFDNGWYVCEGCWKLNKTTSIIYRSTKMKML